MPDRFAKLFDDLPYLLGGHLMLSLCCALIGVLVSVPFGALATRHPKLQGPVLTIAGLIQTIRTSARNCLSGRLVSTGWSTAVTTLTPPSAGLSRSRFLPWYQSRSAARSTSTARLKKPDSEL